MSVGSFLTGGLFDPTGPQYGSLATHNERQRQAMINQGLQQINAIFNGGTTDFYSMANAGGNKFGMDWRNRTDPYYILGDKGFHTYRQFGDNPGSQNPFAVGPGSNSVLQEGLSNIATPAPGVGLAMHHTINGDYGAAAASWLTGGISDIGGLFGGNQETPLDRASKLYNRGRLLNKTTATYEGFQPSFYDQRAQDYINYALPQEGQQYRTNLNATTYNLANRGLLNSSQATKQFSDLNRTDIAAKQNIADQAIAQSNALRQQVSNAQQQAIQMLYQTGDPNLAAHNAITAAASATGPSVFAPISNMFGNLATSIYTNQLLNQYRGGGGGSYNETPYYNMSGALPTNS